MDGGEMEGNIQFDTVVVVGYVFKRIFWEMVVLTLLISLLCMLCKWREGREGKGGEERRGRKK